MSDLQKTRESRIKERYGIEHLNVEKQPHQIIYEKTLLINQYKIDLSQSDYKAIKFAEGLISHEVYQPVKEYRENLRKEIRKLENEINSLNKSN